MRATEPHSTVSACGRRSAGRNPGGRDQVSTLLGRWRALAAVTALAGSASLAVSTLQASADQKQDGAAGAEQKPALPRTGEQKPGGSGAEPGGAQKPPAPGEPKPAEPAASQRIPVGPTVTEASVEVAALTLDESIAIAEGNNPQITIARSQVGQAQALARERGAER